MAPMALTTRQDSSNNAQCRQAVTHRGKGMDRFQPVMAGRSDFFLHEGFDFMRTGISDNDQPCVVAK